MGQSSSSQYPSSNRSHNGSHYSSSNRQQQNPQNSSIPPPLPRRDSSSFLFLTPEGKPTQHLSEFCNAIYVYIQGANPSTTFNLQKWIYFVQLCSPNNTPPAVDESWWYKWCQCHSIEIEFTPMMSLTKVGFTQSLAVDIACDPNGMYAFLDTLLKRVPLQRSNGLTWSLSRQMFPTYPIQHIVQQNNQVHNLETAAQQIDHMQANVLLEKARQTAEITRMINQIDVSIACIYCHGYGCYHCNFKG
eukprot:NODE_255_length_11697_cov_0.569495.p4 type:complete len:246 gc:universal NODE_255_length_11697_cov_0.569495:2473-3210(+)